MSELQIFKNAEFGSVRTITVEGEPYFVGKDVAEILGYSNTRKALADHVDEVLANPDIIINALLELKAERERNANLQAVVAVQNQQMIGMQPKVSYYDVVLNCKDLVAISVIAKDYGWSATKLNQYLQQKGIQYKQGGKIWLLYQKYAEKGYTSTKTHSYLGSDGNIHTKVHTYWTQRGRLFIYDLLKADGILPLVEQEV